MWKVPVHIQNGAMNKNHGGCLGGLLGILLLQLCGDYSKSLLNNQYNSWLVNLPPPNVPPPEIRV